MNTDTPGYWMFESTGVLRPAIEAYLGADEMSPHDIAAMRAYLRQWITAPCWRGPEIEALRSGVDALTSRTAFEAWLAIADAIGIDPL
jgi:hypothetical protein